MLTSQSQNSYILTFIAHIISWKDSQDNKMQQQGEPNFFATQIPQQPPTNQDLPKPIENLPSPEKSIEKSQDDLFSLKSLLIAFNSFDKQEKGLIQISDVAQILSQRGVSTQRINEYHEMSLPIIDKMVSFDQFLFILNLSQGAGDRVQDKYVMCKKVDERLIEFLKMLNKYRKKSEKSGNYKQAKNSKSKIEQIKSRELKRRNKYLKILYEDQISKAEQAQKTILEKVCTTWDVNMNTYQNTAEGLVINVKNRQIKEIAEFQAATREELAAKMHFSKYILELQHKEKNLVKIQEYEKARLIQEEIAQLKEREYRDKEVADQQILDLRLKALRKQQEVSMNTLLQKIQKDRNQHMKQRQAEIERLMVRNKSQITEIDHRFNQTMKKIYQALNNLGIESQKSIKIGKE